MARRGKQRGEQMPAGPAKGRKDASGMIQTPLRLDPETHAQVRARAVTHNTSFNAQAALLIEWGLEAEKDAD